MYTREHSQSTRVGMTLGMYVKGFTRMIPKQEFEALKRQEPNLTPMSAPAHRKWVTAEKKRLLKLRADILAAV